MGFFKISKLAIGFQNGVVERRNHTLIEPARTMLIYAQAPLFLWAEAVTTTCFTQNRSIVRLRHGKTPYELMHDKQPDLSYFHVFGALCYPTNDGENVGCPYNVDLCKSSVVLMGRSSGYCMLHPKPFHYISLSRKKPYELLHNKPPDQSFLHVFGALCYPTNDSENFDKLQPKADICIFIVYAPTKKAFQIYNRCTRQIIETIHVDFNELIAMAFEQSSSGPAHHEMTLAIIRSGLVPNNSPSTLFVPPSRSDWDILFQPLVDELLTPSHSVDFPAPEFIALIAKVVAPEPAVSTSSPSSKTIDQDAPSPSNSQTTPET
nr:retrovirus-related Pol polyprotein from transposon TNT 1-94 [Tanacetum cinerariifolium]